MQRVATILIALPTIMLTAERQRREQAEGAQRHMEACRSLLNVPNDEVLWTAIQDMREQLLSSLAAIEKVKHRLTKYTGLPIGADDIKILESVDLSLLHELKAEVCKPLVDLLQWIRKQYEAADDGRALDMCDRIDDALAKIKNES